MKEVIELPPQCLICKHFSYHQDTDKLYHCKAICMQTNDIFEMWEECIYLDKKYLIREHNEEMD